MMYTKIYGENTLTYDDEFDDVGAELENAFVDEKGEIAPNVLSFIGLAFHQIQQCGGLLIVNEKRVGALVMDQTSGNPVNPEDIVSVDYEHAPVEFIRIKELLS